MATKPSSSAQRSRPATPAGEDDARPANPRAATKGLGAVVIRNEFYRDGYRVLQSIAVMQAIMIVVLIFIMMYVVHIHQPENRYFATTEDGRLIPMVALSEPNLSTPALTSWAAQAATEVMTFGFHDYRRRLQESSRNFTRTGWSSFTAALDQAKTIPLVESQQMVVTATPTAAPIVIQEGLNRGRYEWRVQMRLGLSYVSPGNPRNESWLVTMLIVRVPRLESPSGVGIEQWVAEPSS
jgi:intracellular multiplication protein IcmL